jgi:hypothetical protein
MPAQRSSWRCRASRLLLAVRWHAYDHAVAWPGGFEATRVRELHGVEVSVGAEAAKSPGLAQSSR